MEIIPYEKKKDFLVLRCIHYFMTDVVNTNHGHIIIHSKKCEFTPLKVVSYHFQGEHYNFSLR